MKCKCGQVYSTLAEIEKCDSYLVVRDEDYQDFLSLELKVRSAKSERRKLSLIAESAYLYAGTLRRCYRCSRLMLKPPGDGAVEYYREDAEDSAGPVESP